ncbi:hypothetical protein Q3G72_000307 [Acer saccharum]|nr:hypothetical protein Q3G72_000307 [Acer saccharum]
MLRVEFHFGRLYGLDADRQRDKVHGLLKELITKYESDALLMGVEQVEESSSFDHSIEVLGGDEEFELYKSQAVSSLNKSELERYLVGAPITHTAAAAAPSPSPQILQDSSANDALRTGEEDLDSLHELERAEVEDSDVEPRTDPSAQPSQTGTRTHNPITVLVVIGEEEEATIRADLLWQWFQLLDSDSDSDSDHPSISEDVSKGAHRIDPPSKESKSVASGEKRKVSLITPQKDDLWKDFCPMMGSHIPTPALDEVCEEYFQSAKEKNAGVVPDRGNQQPSASDIDYMSQFSNGGASNQKGTQKANNNRSTTRGRNSRASGGWVDPKSSATIAKDAGKRRVHASGGQSAGHWYTSPEGRKVYLSKNGQELTGQIAYRQYRKENGAGFRKSKKKTNSRKKKTKS